MVAAAVGLAIIGTIQQARAESKASKQNAKIERSNARVAERLAKDAEQRGAEDIRRLRIQGRKLLGTQRTAIASQGIQLGEGTASVLEQDTQAMIELDSLQIANNAAMEAYGYRTQASDAQQRARLRRQEGRDRVTGTLLAGGASAIAQGYSAYQARKG